MRYYSLNFLFILTIIFFITAANITTTLILLIIFIINTFFLDCNNINFYIILFLRNDNYYRMNETEIIFNIHYFINYFDS